MAHQFMQDKWLEQAKEVFGLDDDSDMHWSLLLPEADVERLDLSGESLFCENYWMGISCGNWYGYGVVRGATDNCAFSLVTSNGEYMVQAKDIESIEDYYITIAADTEVRRLVPLEPANYDEFLRKLDERINEIYAYDVQLEGVHTNLNLITVTDILWKYQGRRNPNPGMGGMTPRCEQGNIYNMYVTLDQHELYKQIIEAEWPTC